MPDQVKFHVTIEFDVHADVSVTPADLADLIDAELKLPTSGHIGPGQHVDLDCDEVGIRVRYDRVSQSKKTREFAERVIAAAQRGAEKGLR